MATSRVTELARPLAGRGPRAGRLPRL